MVNREDINMHVQRVLSVVLQRGYRPKMAKIIRLKGGEGKKMFLGTVPRHKGRESNPLGALRPRPPLPKSPSGTDHMGKGHLPHPGQ